MISLTSEDNKNYIFDVESLKYSMYDKNTNVLKIVFKDGETIHVPLSLNDYVRIWNDFSYHSYNVDIDDWEQDLVGEL